MIDYPRTYFGWSATSPADYADPESGLVIHYNGDATGLDSHAECVSYWKGVRNSHLGQSWADIGYSFGVDIEGGIFEGRGLHRYQAAQGTTAGNSNYYSVSLMIGGSEQPTAAQIEGVRRLRQWLMNEHNVAGTVLGHRDFISTSCPGTPLYALVTDGTFEQPPGAISDMEDDVIYGLKKGDYGPRVRILQYMIRAAGFGAALEPYNVDGDYGDGTAEGVRQCREYVGSRALAGYGDEITEAAEVQMRRAVAKREAQKLIDSMGLSSGGSSTGTSLEGATLTAKVTGVQQ